MQDMHNDDKLRTKLAMEAAIYGSLLFSTRRRSDCGSGVSIIVSVVFFCLDFQNIARAGGIHDEQVIHDEHQRAERPSGNLLRRNSGNTSTREDLAPSSATIS